MKPLWQGVLVGVFAYLLFMVTTAPAAKIVSFVQPQGIRFSAIEGSLWSGSAALVDVPPVQLTHVRWSFRPFSLFVGQIGYAVEGQLQGQKVEARIGSSFLGKPYISDVRGRLAAKDLPALLGQKQLQLSGELAFDIADVEWPGSGYPALEGT
ncbi:MAG TPA: hypothetical protein ENI74_05245, partial [Gammaproteobacteria bacterium]|nr:hypothetical protein [Gammaproteobacteria bacterium]